MGWWSHVNIWWYVNLFISNDVEELCFSWDWEEIHFFLFFLLYLLHLFLYPVCSFCNTTLEAFRSNSHIRIKLWIQRLIESAFSAYLGISGNPAAVGKCFVCCERPHPSDGEQTIDPGSAWLLKHYRASKIQTNIPGSTSAFSFIGTCSTGNQFCCTATLDFLPKLQTFKKQTLP